MRRVILLMLVPLMACAGVSAQSTDIEAIIAYSGVSSAEELDETQVEYLQHLLRNPLRINVASDSALRKSGLFSRYQIASLRDYISRHGDVLSYSELSSIDGFGEKFTAKSLPFISLVSHGSAGKTDYSKSGHELTSRLTVTTGKSPSYGFRYGFSGGTGLDASLSFSRSHDAGSMCPDAFAGGISLAFRRIPVEVLAGCFNARFGQGLALWNGFSPGGNSYPSSFMRRSPGVSLSRSFTGNYSMKGIAGSLDLGKLEISVLAATDRKDDKLSLLPALNMSYVMRNGQIGLTHYSDFMFSSSDVALPDMKTSVDMAFCMKGVDIFAETALDWTTFSAAFLAGAVCPAGENGRMAFMLRYYPPDFSPSRSGAAKSLTKCENEVAASVSGEFARGKSVTSFSLDAAHFPLRKADDTGNSIQIKGQAEWTAKISESFRLKFKLSERVRTWGEPFQTGLRSDISYVSGQLTALLRLEARHCAGLSFLSYCEGGYKENGLAAYLRMGVFRVDDWDDRIYVYERDAPGSFNVPAFYGRGLWGTVFLSWRLARWAKAYVRASITSYPFMKKSKPGKAELRLQIIVDL